MGLLKRHEERKGGCEEGEWRGEYLKDEGDWVLVSDG